MLTVARSRGALANGAYLAFREGDVHLVRAHDRLCRELLFQPHLDQRLVGYVSRIRSGFDALECVQR